MGKSQRDKGMRNERDIVSVFKKYDFNAERVPLSGSAQGSFTGDVVVPFMGGVKRIEAKVRAVGFKQIYEWIDDNYALVIKQDRRPHLAVIELETLASLMRLAESYAEEKSE